MLYQNIKLKKAQTNLGNHFGNFNILEIILTISKTGFRGTYKKAFCEDERELAECRLLSYYWIHYDFLKDQIIIANKKG